ARAKRPAPQVAWPHVAQLPLQLAGALGDSVAELLSGRRRAGRCGALQRALELGMVPLARAARVALRAVVADQVLGASNARRQRHAGSGVLLSRPGARALLCGVRGRGAARGAIRNASRNAQLQRVRPIAGWPACRLADVLERVPSARVPPARTHLSPPPGR